MDGVRIYWDIQLGQALLVAFLYACFIFLIERIWLLSWWLADKATVVIKKLIKGVK